LDQAHQLEPDVLLYCGDVLVRGESPVSKPCSPKPGTISSLNRFSGFRAGRHRERTRLP